MFETVGKIKDLLNKIERLENLSFYGDAEKVITRKLIEELRVHSVKWQRRIRESFNEYFLKQANLAVLRKKTKEIENE